MLRRQDIFSCMNSYAVVIFSVETKSAPTACVFGGFRRSRPTRSVMLHVAMRPNNGASVSSLPQLLQNDVGLFCRENGRTRMVMPAEVKRRFGEPVLMAVIAVKGTWVECDMNAIAPPPRDEVVV